MPCNDISRRTVIKQIAVGATGTLLLSLFPRLSFGNGESSGKTKNAAGKRPLYAYAVDTSRCIGCCACMRGCRAENDVPKDRYRTWVERYRVLSNGEVQVDVAANDQFVFQDPPPADITKAFFVPKLCNHCEKSVCSQVCPIGASYETPEGVVLVDTKRCVGCGYCVQACPYGCRFIHPETHMASKCTLCYHRITRGLLPACVQSCPKGARMFGDLHDPLSHLSIFMKQRRYRVLKPEMGTKPKCYYVDLDIEVI
jgi:Fe-S-cluster-containing dehydrogenase component